LEKLFFGFLVIWNIDLGKIACRKLVFGKMVFRKWDFDFWENGYP